MVESPWISVEDSLPEDGAQIDVWVGHIFNCREIECYFSDGGFYESSTEDGKIMHVTHWQPIVVPE